MRPVLYGDVIAWNEADFYIEWNLLLVAPGAGIKDLGVNTLDAVTQVPTNKDRLCVATILSWVEQARVYIKKIYSTVKLTENIS